MSSPLDGRIRSIAREEAASIFLTAEQSEEWKARQARLSSQQAPDWRAEMQQQITDLHEHLHHAATTIKRLEDRLDALEKAAAGTSPRRSARKTAEPSE